MIESGLLFYFLFIGLMLLCSSFFSGSETGLTAASRSRIYRLETEGNPRARMVGKLKESNEKVISAILLGNNAVNIAASSVATALCIQLWGETTGTWVAAIAMTVLVLIFGEIMPKTYAINNAERVALAVAPVFTVYFRVVYPIVHGFQVLISGIFKLFGIQQKNNEHLISATESLRGAIDLHHQEGEMVKHDRDMLGSILDLDDIYVSDVMVHRKQIDTIDIDQPIEVVLQEILTSSHTRLPLWQEDPDNIIGVLNVKSLVRHMKDSNWQIDRDTLLSLCSTPWFIPETTTLKDQLLAFRQKRQHFAIVVDEYGSLLGIVTLEDIIEEIVGEIDDEMDEEEVQEISAVEEGVWQLEGSLSIRTLNRHLDTRFPEDSASTVAGLFLQEFREIPELGDAFERDSYRFTVLEKEGNRITRLRMERVTESENGES